MIVFKHLLNTPHRRALLPHIDKLCDDRVVLGSGEGSKETIRLVVEKYLQLLTSDFPLELWLIQFLPTFFIICAMT